MVFALLAWLPVGAIRAEPADGAAAAGRDIPPGALDDALNAFATRNRLQLIYAPALVAHRRSAGLRGNPGAREGLAQLLEGTGLTAVAIKANTYLLQAAPRSSGARETVARKPAAASGPTTPTQLDTVHVTGSRIGRAEFETSLPLTLITQEQIRASGLQTLFDVLRLTPGMSGHHPRNNATEGGISQAPSAAAAAASLYSLGPRATLFLIDGRRIASYGLVSGEMGALTDLNGIPLSMVERIEIARGGASAIYGADAMAGVVNIILKKDYRGAEVGASYGVSQHGDAEQQRQYASFGAQTPGGGDVFVNIDRYTRNPLIGSQRDWSTLDRRRFGGSDRRIAFGYLSYDDDLHIRPTSGCIDRDSKPAGVECSFDIPRYVSLQPGINSNALYATYRQPFGEGSEFYADLRVSRVGLELRNAPTHGVMPLSDDHPDADPQANGYSSLNYWFSDVGPVRNRVVTTSNDYAVGIKGHRDRWRWDMNLSRGSNRVVNRVDGLISLSAIETIITDHSYRFNQLNRNAPQTLAALSPQATLGGEMSLDTATASVEGPLFALPAGEVRFAAGVETRHEHLRNRADPSLLSGDIVLAQEFSDRSDSRDASSIYGEFNAPLYEKLWANAAWRLDRNRGYGNRVSPMFGLRWQPWRSLILRASYGDGYRAPTLAELRLPPVITNQASYWVRADAVTRPCHLEDDDYCWVSVRTKVNTEVGPESSVSRTLGLIWTPTEDFNVKLNHYRIRRKNEILVVSPLEFEQVPAKALIRDAQGELIAIGHYLDNVGSTDARGWEIETEYQHKSDGWGDFLFSVDGQYTQRLQRRLRPGEAAIDYAGVGTPDRSVLGSVRWSYRDWIATFNLRYMGPAEIAVPTFLETFTFESPTERRRRIPATTLAGVDLAYGGFPRWLIALNVANLSDRRPGNYDYNEGGYSIADDDPVGRYYLISATHRF
ncbi:MAG: TonB-dependent receptor domain-containing protein [Lysobacter sp.]